MKYNHKSVEQKWQKIWEDKGVFHASEDTNKEKFYALIEFPYPSGQGLHVGHPRPYTALDTVARKRRLEGYNVLYPIGWDAFGLPTENYAIKNHIHPAQVTRDNIANFGGDPGNVTIMGQSGGGGKVAALLTCAPAQGLFHKAAQFSGGGSITLTVTENTALLTMTLRGQSETEETPCTVNGNVVTLEGGSTIVLENDQLILTEDGMSMVFEQK